MYLESIMKSKNYNCNEQNDILRIQKVVEEQQIGSIKSKDSRTNRNKNTVVSEGEQVGNPSNLTAICLSRMFLLQAYIMLI